MKTLETALENNELTTGLSPYNVWERLDKAGVEVRFKDLCPCLDSVYIKTPTFTHLFIKRRLAPYIKSMVACRFLIFHLFGPNIDGVTSKEVHITNGYTVAIGKNPWKLDSLVNRIFDRHKGV